MAASVHAILFDLIPLASDGAASAPFTHERGLVGLSMLVAVLGAFAALELAGRWREAQGAARLGWIGASGALLGAGLWATHFVGMAAFESPLAHGFALAPTALSALIGAGACAGAFVIGAAGRNAGAFLVASLIIAAGAVTMHYVGMRGLSIEAELAYRPGWVGATVLGAFACSMIAFSLAQSLSSLWMRAAAAFPIGAGSAGLHYADMAATVITPRPAFLAPAPGFPEPLLAGLVAGGFALIAALALVAVWLDVRAAARRAAAPPDDAVVEIPTPSGADAVVLPLRGGARRR